MSKIRRLIHNNIPQPTFNKEVILLHNKYKVNISFIEVKEIYQILPNNQVVQVLQTISDIRDRYGAKMSIMDLLNKLKRRK